MIMPDSVISTTRPGLNPEAELLLCCARLQMDAANAERVRDLLRGEINWNDLISFANCHGVMPLLCRNLSCMPSEAICGHRLDQVKSHFFANAQRNLFLTRELLKILKLFESCDIPAIPYKGPVLAVSIYGDLALRQCIDLDILLRKQDVSRAAALLISQGFTQVQHLHNKKAAVEHALKLVNDCSQLIVELHWEVVPGYVHFSMDYEYIWQSNYLINLGGMLVPTIPPEEMLIILCVHGHRHSWKRLGWVCDLAEFVCLNEDLDWESVIKKAGELGVARVLFSGLLLAGDLLGGPLPEKILPRLRADKKANQIASSLGTWLLTNESVTPGGFQRNLLKLKTRERLLHRISYSIQMARYYLRPNEKDKALVFLPPSLSFLYYLIRPFRLIWEYRWKPLRLFD
jgi:hypothetical protein